MTFNNGTSFNLSAGTGQILDYTTAPSTPTLTKVTIPAQTVTLTSGQLANEINWWGINAAGTLVTQTTEFSPTQRRSLIQLGVTPVVAGAIDKVQAIPQYIIQPVAQLADALISLGAWNLSPAPGNTIAANGANLSINLTGGDLFSFMFNFGVDPNNPHVSTAVSETLASFFRATRVSGSEVAATTLDVQHYDNNGVLTVVPANANATIQRVYLFATGVAGTQIVIQYGDKVFNSLSTALSNVGIGSTFVPNPDLNNGGALIAYIGVTKQCTSLLDANNAFISIAGKFANP